MMASITQRREALSDEDICAAAAFKLRGDDQTYFQLKEAVIEDNSLGSLAKSLRRRFGSKLLSQRAVPDLWRSKQSTEEIATAFEMQRKPDEVIIWCRDTIVANDIVVSRLANRQNVSTMTTHSHRERVECSDDLLVDLREGQDDWFLMA